MEIKETKKYRHTYCLSNGQTWTEEIIADNWTIARKYGHKYAKEHATTKNTNILWEITQLIH